VAAVQRRNLTPSTSFVELNNLLYLLIRVTYARVVKLLSFLPFHWSTVVFSHTRFSRKFWSTYLLDLPGFLKLSFQCLCPVHDLLNLEDNRLFILAGPGFSARMLYYVLAVIPGVARDSR
jgi:hypothetical protein